MRHEKKGGSRRCDTVDRARRTDVETVPPQPGDADSKNLRSRSSLLSQLSKSNANRIDTRGRPDSQKDPGPSRSAGHAKSRPARRRPVSYPKNSSTTIRTPKSRNTTIGTESLPIRKKIETGIGAGLRPETGRFPCFSRFFRLPQTMFNSSAIFAHSSSDSTTARPPAPALHRNMLRRRAGAGGRETGADFLISRSRVPEIIEYFTVSCW